MIRWLPWKLISGFSLEARRADPSPNNVAVTSAVLAVKPNTAKSGRRSNASGRGDRGSRETSSRVPHTDKKMAQMAPTNERRKCSVNNCQAIRPRLAPRARRTMISGLRAPLRAKIRLAMFAHEIRRTTTTTASNTSSGFSYFRPMVARPDRAGRSVTCCPSNMDFQRGDAPGRSASATCARNAVSNMACAWDTSTPGRKRIRSRSQLMFGSGRHPLSNEAVTGTQTSTDTSGSIPKNPGCATPTTV